MSYERRTANEGVELRQEGEDPETAADRVAELLNRDQQG